jgi:hypothetical protein
MERADWLEGGFDSAQARFLMLTAITHHQFRSRAAGEREIRGSTPSSRRSTFRRARVLESRRGPSAWIRRPAQQPWREAQEAC